MSDPTETFSPAVRLWFREKFGEPTPPQAQGWLPIQRGEHTLILAPTGSGKTLAAFLWGIDELYRDLTPQPPLLIGEGKPKAGVRLLYISPLKALNNDIERNLRVPLEGIRAAAARLHQELPTLRVAVRTGDTPSSVRAQMLKHPPHILITTPESLYLMLTSPRARNMFCTVRSVIVDEIHTLCGNKRGVHLALSLERLCHLAEGRVQRIGLSATIKPLEEAARFLGGQEKMVDEGQTIETNNLRPPSFVVRPVTIVNAHYQKPLDLRVVTVVDDFRNMPGDTIWPSVIPNVLADIRRHQTTLIFANNRRLAERTADRLNAQLAAEESEDIPPGSTEALAPGGVARDRGIFAIGAQGPIRAHHGSMSKDARRKMEEDLKAGKLPALVGTSSLELGIDIGAVDLVVQLQSPKSVAQGLQRVGRSGHLVGQTSHGRIYPTFREDLAEAAAIARGMLEGDVEPTATPQNPLDVLAQQIVAMVAMEDWNVNALYDLVRQAYPYRDLLFTSYRAVLEMLTGKYYFESPARAASSLRAKIAWDRVHDRLTALPGSRLLAISNVGTIPDTGAFGVYLGDGKTKVGELDEEFIFETRVGDAFLLGSNVWRVREIKDDRIIVADAAGATPRMPFWNGDYPWRPYELGARIGKFRRELAEKISLHPERSGVHPSTPPHSAEPFGPADHTVAGDEHAAQYILSHGEGSKEMPDIEQWLRREYALDEKSAINLVAHVKNQLDAIGLMSSDRTIVVESFTNAVGDPHLVIHSPFGGRVNGAWALALSSALQERTGIVVEMQANDDGIIFKFPQSDYEPPLDLVQQMTASEARERILRELPNSAVFGAQFRMNAARALLLSKPRAGKRTPFWLQRLRARDLLALVRKFDDFPIVTETYRDCLRDVFDMPHLEQILMRIQSGDIRVVAVESVIPSPIASGLLFNFVSQYMYEWDAPKAERQLQALSLRPEALEDLLQGIELSNLLKPEAIVEVVARAQHLAPGYQSRTVEELALALQELGDLTTDEIIARTTGYGRAWVEQLAADQRVTEIQIPTPKGTASRWVPVELADEYLSAFPPPHHPERSGVQSKEAESKDGVGTAILRRFLRHAGPVTRQKILERYAFPEDWLDETCNQLVAAREIVRAHFTSRDRDEFCDASLLEQIHRRTLTLLRHQVQPVSIYAYAEFLARWQHLHQKSDDLRNILQQLRGVALPGIVWERDVLPARVADYAPEDLDALSQSGELVWVGTGREPKRGRVRFFFRGEGALFVPPPDDSGLSADARKVFDYLKDEGASFATDLQVSLGLTSSSLSNALVELVMCGLITNDSLDALRNILRESSISPASAEREPLSSLEAELTARLRASGRPALTPTRYREAKRRVAQRLRASAPRHASPWSGRWSLVHRAGVMGPALSEEARAEKLARVLLARYGVVTREVVEHEELPMEWAQLYPQFQLMELRGQVRRGYFVAGLLGIQFALPDAVEKLRAASDMADESLILLNATDSANLFGGELSAAPSTAVVESPRFARLPSTWLVLWRGQPVLVAEDSGERITTMSNVDASVLQRALEVLITRPHAPRHLMISQWNGAHVWGSEGQPLLEALGFYRAPNGMEWWANPYSDNVG